jgi:hypothetical protein
MAYADASTNEVCRVANCPDTLPIEENEKAVASGLESDPMGGSARPGDVHTPQGDKSSLASAGSPIDLEIVGIAWRRCLVIPNGEDVVVLVVGKPEDQPAIVNRVRERLHPTVGQRHRVSD